MDQSLWQTTESFDILHPSHMWIHTILSCGKHCKTMQIGTVSGLWFCRRPWRLKINIRWTLVHFPKSHVRANKLDVQEANFSFTQFNRSCDYFSWCRFTHGWDSRSRSLGCSDRRVSFSTEQHRRTQERATGDRRQLSSQTCITPSQSSTPTSFQQTLITFRPIQRILVPVLCRMSLRTMRL